MRVLVMSSIMLSKRCEWAVPTPWVDGYGRERPTMPLLRCDGEMELRRARGVGYGGRMSTPRIS